MRTWNLEPGVQLPLVLGTDFRLGATDYCNDQTWELVTGKGEPPALALMTTYGLRARSQRIFPRFIEGDKDLVDPAEFARSVRIRQFYPNYIETRCSPFPGIEVTIEYWAPEPHVIAARTLITNTSVEQRKIQLEWAVMLYPLPGGQRMVPLDIGLTHTLAGKTEGVFPVLYMSGGVHHGSGPFTSLSLTLDLAPRTTGHSTWALASLGSIDASFELSRQVLEQNWDAEIARILRVNASQLEIYTGDPDWDLAFALAQYRACGFLFQATEHLRNPSFVTTRLPDHGFSYRGDGSDYSHHWNGQTPLDTLYMIDYLLPSHVEIAQGLLQNFLDVQSDNGFIDWKPGLAGQRSQVLATPLLASMAWKIYQVSEDRTFLEAVFSGLLSFLHHWFSADYDRDGDGIPEWDYPLQTGLDEHPLFSPWESWSQGVNITSIESPDLCALLYRECKILLQIANIIGRNEPISALEAFSDHLKTAVETAWNENSSSYHYWDRESHDCADRELLGSLQGSGEVTINRQFAIPVRLNIEIQSSDESTRSLQIYIHGNTTSGGHRVEKIDHEEIRWHLGRSRVTSERIYSAIEHIELQGLKPSDQVLVHTVGHKGRDITTLLPLWAGIPDPKRANQLIKHTLTNPKIFWGRFGIRLYAESNPKNQEANRHYKNMHIPYSCLLGEGLLHYEQVTKAAELVTHIMKAILQSLKQEGNFHRVYHTENGKGSGERCALSGLPPLGLFLDVLGVHIISPKKVILSGSNPFSWPVTVKYNGLSVVRQKSKTLVIFPDGQNITIKNGKTQVVGLE